MKIPRDFHDCGFFFLIKLWLQISWCSAPVRAESDDFRVIYLKFKTDFSVLNKNAFKFNQH